MPRHRTYRERDETPEILGDRGFVGVNMRLDPAMLPPGYVAEAINCRFNRGIIETRKGFQFPVWANKASSVTGTVTRLVQVATFSTTGAVAHNFYSGQRVSINGFNAAEYNGAFTVTVLTASTFSYTVTGSPATPDPNTGLAIGQGTIPWGTIFGVGVFSDPNTLKDYLIVATAAGVYYTSPNNVPYQIPLPAGVTLSDTVNFTQAFDRLIMHRGEGLTALELKSITDSWTEIVQTPSGNGTETIPQAKRSLFFQNRLFIPFGNDQVAVSDFNDYTRYVPVLQEMRINQGSSDRLIALVKFNDITVIAFKEQSIYAINNVYGNLAAIQLDEITNKFGLIAVKSIAHVGSDLWFLSSLGVMSIRQTEQNKLQGVALPVSEAIQPLIDRINWKYAMNAVAAYWDNKYYLAVPLDDAKLTGVEVTLGQAEYNSITGDAIVSNLENGSVYRWIKGANDISISNGTETFTSSTNITVRATSLTLHGGGLTPVTASLRRVFIGVNNAIIIYDLLNQAWAGYDQADGLAISDFFIYTMLDKRRLFASSSDSYIRLFEETFEDQLANPYLDVTIISTPAIGNTVRINKGATITGIAGTVSTPTQWALGSPDLPASITFFVNATVDTSLPSYSNFSLFRWSAPNTSAYILPINGQFRFYGTNGLVPTIETTGSWAVVKSTTTQQIVSSITTRDYGTNTFDTQEYNWLSLFMETWNPNYSVDLIMDGENEVFNQVTGRTKDRTKWYAPFDKADFDLLNAGGQFMDKYRQDYSLLLGNGGSAGEASSIAFYTTTGGLNLGLHQLATETFKTTRKDVGAQVRITNSQGRFRLSGVTLESRKAQTSAITKA